MGGGLTFLSKKSFNPSNWSNQRRVWEARQQSDSERRRIVEREAQIKREREEEELARAVSGESGSKRKQLGFMYDGGKIPGLKKETGDNRTHEQDEHETRNGDSSGGDTQSNLFQRQPGDDDAAAAFRAMLAQGIISTSDDTEKLPDEHVKVETTADKNNSNEARDNRTNLEKAVGRGIGSGVTLAQQIERFPMLRGAPMVLQKQKKTGDGEKNQQDAANDVASMNFKPLGQVLRNVQCMACKKWGHARGERECELSGWNPFRMNTPAEGTPNNTSAAADTSSAQTTLQANNDRQGEEIKILHSERENKNRRKDDRHVKKKKKKTKKHKRRRRERSPSYSSDSYSSYDSYSSPSKEDHYKKRRRDYYSSDDSHNRHQSKTGRRQKSSRK